MSNSAIYIADRRNGVLIRICCGAPATGGSQSSPNTALKPAMFLQHARRPTRLTGIGMYVAAYVLQAVAMSLRPVTLIQQLISVQPVFALVPSGSPIISVDFRRHHRTGSAFRLLPTRWRGMSVGSCKVSVLEVRNKKSRIRVAHYVCQAAISGSPPFRSRSSDLAHHADCVDRVCRKFVFFQ